MLVWKIFFFNLHQEFLLVFIYFPLNGSLYLFLVSISRPSSSILTSLSRPGPFSLSNLNFVVTTAWGSKIFLIIFNIFWWIFPILKISSSSIQLKIGDRKNQALFLKWTTERYNNDLNENKKVSMSDPFDQFIFFKLQAIALSLFKLLLTNTLKILFEMSSMTMIASSSVLFPGT